MNGYEITSNEGARIWAAEDEDHAREQHADAFPGETIISVRQTDPWWIYIERDRSDDLAVGPYATEDLAELALDGSLLVDGFTEDDCLDSWVSDEQPGDRFERVIIDPEDPHHFG